MSNQAKKSTDLPNAPTSRSAMSSREGSLHTAIFSPPQSPSEDKLLHTSMASPQASGNHAENRRGETPSLSPSRGEKRFSRSISPPHARSAHVSPPRRPSAPKNRNLNAPPPEDDKGVEFTMELYRELHQRNFHSVREELNFLRSHFVSSRKTLAVLNEETRRLRQVLRERMGDIRDLKEKLAWFERRYGNYQDLILQENTTRGAKEIFLSESLEKENGNGEKRRPYRGETSSEGVKASTELALYAAAASATSKIRKRPAAATTKNELNTVELINELRRNLARRDTALEQCKLELNAVKEERNTLESTSNQRQKALVESEKEKRELRTELERKTDGNAALEEQLRASRVTLDAQERELADLRRKIDLAEILKGYPGIPAGDPTPSTAPPRVETAGHPSEMDYLYEQVRSYRAKWQTAEDRIDELRRQLHAREEAGTAEHRKATLPLSDAQQRRYETEIRDQLETIHRLQRKLDREQERAAFASSEERRQRQEEQRAHAAEVSTLRSELLAAKTHLDGLTSQRETLLQQFRGFTTSEQMETALRGQNEALRQRQQELTAELAESTARGRQLEADLQLQIAERAQLQRENEGLFAELQQLREREAMLQEELHRLRTEVGVREGRVFALERMVSQPWHAARARFLPREGGTHPDEVESAGEAEDGSDDALEMPSSRPRSGQPADSEDGHPYNRVVVKPPGSPILFEAASSAPYATLLNLNSALQRRLLDMEQELTTAFAALQSPAWSRPVGETDAPKLLNSEMESIGLDPTRGLPDRPVLSNSNLVSTSDHVTPDLDFSTQPVKYLVQNLLKELGQLQADLKHARQVHKQLSKKWKALKKEYKAVLEDNVILANGAEAICKELFELKKREGKSERSRRTPSPRADLRELNKLHHREKKELHSQPSSGLLKK
ncbi:unnamed protein product [Phytomonas sp. EM1]|nr:unnamed protein product [Phytomonas sp. EM1]|eukprot:CCW62549.1 unnamed protein product [Phytomonas sp. isolate EM1]